MKMEKMPEITRAADGSAFWKNTYDSFEATVYVPKSDLPGDILNYGFIAPYLLVFAEKHFDFDQAADFAKEKGTSCIMCHEQPSIEKLQRTGVVELDENHRVLGMEEKPQVPKSHWAVPPFYIYLKKDLDLIRHSVENGCGKDAPGNLAHYMVEHTTMHAWPMSAGRFDIGSLDTYYEAVKRFASNTGDQTSGTVLFV